MINFSAWFTCTRLGAERRHEACTTQPRICATGSAAAMLPSGSTALSGSPSTNHHGTPLSTGTIIVPGPISGLSSDAGPGGGGLDRAPPAVPLAERAAVVSGVDGSDEFFALFLQPQPLRLCEPQRVAAREDADVLTG